MDPKVANLVIKIVDEQSYPNGPDFTDKEPNGTKLARFAEALVGAQRDHNFTDQMRSLGSPDDVGPPILTPDEVAALKQALLEIEIASRESEDEGNPVTKFFSGIIGQTESEKDQEAYGQLVSALSEHAADDRKPAAGAPAGDSFETEDGRYSVTVYEDGKVTFTDTENGNVLGNAPDDSPDDS